MGCCNEASVALASAVRDPSLHVNYAKGMVLGVDDFTQEFAYLSGRDQWMVRELIGYGTASGLAVTLDDTPDGPRVRVSRGAAVVPSGKLVCVPSEQCGLLDKWLAKADSAQQINLLLGGGSPPLSPPASPPVTQTVIPVYLTLCHAECLTQPVPIPGDPCRSEDLLMAPSRVADDYLLDLRTVAPAQTEEDALRDFAGWLRQVPITDSSPPPTADEKAWIAGLQAAVKPWLDAAGASPPLTSPPTVATLGDYFFDSPPTTLLIGRPDWPAFMNVAMRFWVTVVRPFWTTRLCGDKAGRDDDCVLLARLDVPILWAGGSPTGAWQVDGKASTIVIDETRRPLLVHQRLLQQWQQAMGPT